MKRNLVALVVLVLMPFSTAAYADTIQGRLDKMPPPQYSSSQKLAALEWCIGVGLGQWFMPSTLHGEGKSLVYIGMDTEFNMGIVSAVLIRDEGETRTIAFQAPKAWVEKTETVIKPCL